MTRFALIPVRVPAGAKFKLERSKIEVTGPLGGLSFEMHHLVKCEQQEAGIFFKPQNDEAAAKAQTGTCHRIVTNMLKGVTEGFTRDLELQGVGYRVELKGQDLVLSLGYSNPVIYKLPADITAKVDGQTKLSLSGIDKQKLGQTVAEIRRLRPPDPYKGKGVRYAGEVISLKETKKK